MSQVPNNIPPLVPPPLGSPTPAPTGNQGTGTQTTAPAPKKLVKDKAVALKPKFKRNYIKPDKWWAVYHGDEEKKFFTALCRDKDYSFRSISMIAKETKISEKRIEEIIDKYMKKGMVFQSPKNPEHFGYWERNEKYLDEDIGSIAEEDQKDRISKAMP